MTVVGWTVSPKRYVELLFSGIHVAVVVFVQLLGCVQLFKTPWAAACQSPLFFIISWSLLRFMSTESVMLSNHPLLSPLLLPSIFPSNRVFYNESALHIRWPKCWSFSISPFHEYSGLISFRIDWPDLLLSKGLSRVFSSTTIQKHQFFGIRPSLWSNSHLHMTTGKTIAFLKVYNIQSDFIWGFGLHQYNQGKTNWATEQHVIDDKYI